MSTIPEVLGEIKGRMYEYIDTYVSEWGSAVLVIVLALTAFGLGRLSASERTVGPIAITSASTLPQSQKIALGGLVVASRTGSVYYLPWCSGASKIALANQVWFATEDAAHRAGYAPSKACAGLQNSL